MKHSWRACARGPLRSSPRCPSRAPGGVLPRPESASSYHGRPPAIHGRLGAHPPMHATGSGVRRLRYGEQKRWSAVAREGTPWTARLPHGERRWFLLKPSPNTLMRRQLRHAGQQRGSRSRPLPRRVWGSSPLTFFPPRRQVGARRGRRGMSRAGHAWPAAGCGSRTRRYPAGHPLVAVAGPSQIPETPARPTSTRERARVPLSGGPPKPPAQLPRHLPPPSGPSEEAKEKALLALSVGNPEDARKRACNQALLSS